MPRDVVRAYWEVSQSVVGLTGDAHFPALVERLCSVLDVDHAVVTERAGADRARTIAAAMGRRLVPNFEYALAGTPCAWAFEGQEFAVESDLCAAFPEDAFLREHGCQSFAAVPMRANAGTVLGHLCLLHSQPLPGAARLLPALRLFAWRAAAELQRRRAEEELGRARLLQTLGRLAGTVAHDFNTVLTIVRAASETFAASFAKDSEEAEALGAIERAVTRGESLVKNLHSFSTRRASPGPVDLNAAAEEAAQRLRPLMGRNVTLQTRLGRGLPRPKADRAQVAQLVMGMILAAREARGGEIVIETAAARMPAAGRAGVLVRLSAGGGAKGLATLRHVVAETGGELAAEGERLCAYLPVD